LGFAFSIFRLDSACVSGGILNAARKAASHLRVASDGGYRRDVASVSSGEDTMATEEPDTPEFKAEVWDRPPEDHPIYAKIGRVASEWSHVEHVLDWIIWGIIGGQPAHAAGVTAQLNGAYSRCNAIIALLEARKVLTQELQNKIEAFRGACSTTGNLRNRIVHDAWYVSLGREGVATWRAMPKEDMRFGLMDLPDRYFENVLAKISRRFQEALVLHKEIFDAMDRKISETTSE
jgi:hypothetical protein